MQAIQMQFKEEKPNGSYDLNVSEIDLTAKGKLKEGKMVGV